MFERQKTFDYKKIFFSAAKKTLCLNKNLFYDFSIALMVFIS